MSRAISEHWSSRRLAKEAGIGNETALKVIREWQWQIGAETSQQLKKQAPSLANVAQAARDGDLRLSERIAVLIDKLTSQLEHSDDIDSKDLAALQATASKRWQHIESLTGLDVVKKIAVAREASKSGEIVSWDGVAALEVSSLQLLPESNDSDLLGDMA